MEIDCLVSLTLITAVFCLPSPVALRDVSRMHRQYDQISAFLSCVQNDPKANY
jgi:hypothetical protein